MIPFVLLLILPAFALSFLGTLAVRRLGLSHGHLDAVGSAGHLKSEIRGVPNTGGVAITAGIILPIVAGLIGVLLLDTNWAEVENTWWSPLQEHLPGIRAQLPMLVTLIGCILGLHLLGLVDDRCPLGPGVKLLVQTIAALVLIIFFDTRLLTLLDQVPGLQWLAPWPSIVVTLLWFLVVTNAVNFMDNMDGLAGGVVAIASGLFLVAACLNEQWFIASTLALILGSVGAFLCFNFPPASIFMGDGGSLVLGYLLAFLTTRTTYFHPDADGGTGGWYGVLMPLIVLAVPLYDLLSVSLIRIRQGKSPLVGDQQHFSHRFVMRGLSPRSAVLMIWGCTLITGIGGVLLSRLADWQAILIAVQTVVILAFIAAYERAALRSAGDENGNRDQLAGGGGS